MACLDGGNIVRDGDAAVSKAKREEEERLGLPPGQDHACVVHVSRNLPKHLWKAYTTCKWSKDFTNAKANPEAYSHGDDEEKWTTAKKYQTYKKHVIDAIRRRAVTEFAYAQHAKRDIPDGQRTAWLVKTCRRAAKCIVRCFTGDHSKCSSWSRMCTAHERDKYVPNHLPNGEYLNMSARDKYLLLRILLKHKLGEAMVVAQRDNLNTNVVEYRWKSTNISSMKGLTSARNHKAKSVSGYLKHSTGYGVDQLRIAVAVGSIVSRALVKRALNKHERHMRQVSAVSKDKRRKAKMARNEFRRAKRQGAGAEDEPGYVGSTKDFLQSDSEDCSE